MGNVAIVTDSNSGISQAEAKELGIYVIPMPFLVDGKLYFEDVDMNKEQFYHFLENDADLSTSQPSPGDVMDLWDKLLKEYDEIVHIPMSSGLSASCSTAMGLARDYDGKVQVVDNQRISVTMQQSVMDAKHLVAAGKSAAQIKEILEKEALEAWDERKRKARVLGETAATKLLVPMVMMLAVVMAIIMIPAFLSFYG